MSCRIDGMWYRSKYKRILAACMDENYTFSNRGAQLLGWTKAGF